VKLFEIWDVLLATYPFVAIDSDSGISWTKIWP